MQKAEAILNQYQLILSLTAVEFTLENKDLDGDEKKELKELKDFLKWALR